jgi:acyl-CoA synthetase (AMP-forming)/AMP-acid ligase II
MTVMHTSPLTAFEHTSRLQPDSAAFVKGDSVTTFSEWRARVDDYRRHLLNLGVGPGDRVLVWMDTGPEMAAAIFGCRGVKGIAAIMDPRAGSAHFSHAVAIAEPRAVVATRREQLPETPPHLSVVDETAVPRTGGSLLPLPQPLPTAPASIVFTSGSTGRPKGVTQSHGHLLRGCVAVTTYLNTGATDRILCTVPWTFDYGYGQLLTAAVRGSTIVLPTLANPSGMCEAIERHRPTVLAGIPSVFTYLLRGPSSFRTTELSSIRTVTNTGGTIPGPVLQDLFALFPDASIFLNYGLTETYRTSFLDPALARSHSTSIGRGIPGVEVVIVNEDGRVARPGEVGEIVHRGDYICLGYWNDAEGTARAVRPDPLATRECPSPPRALFTGDVGVIDDEGLLYFRGRRDQQLKSMGVRVSPGEVEELLFSSGLVRDVAVVGAPHELIGDEICAFVVANDHAGGAAVSDQLARFARRVMSPYMIPRRIVECTALPKTATGKTDYPTLKQQVRAPHR